MVKRKRSLTQLLDDRYTQKPVSILGSPDVKSAKIEHEADSEKKLLDHYLNGSNYFVQPDENGNLHVIMNDSEEVPAEFIPRLRAQNRYIDMAFSELPQREVLSALPQYMIDEQRYSPEYQNVLRRQRQNVYKYNQAKQQAQTTMNTGLDYVFNPARWYDVAERTLGGNGLSNDDIATVGLATMFLPIAPGKFKAVPEIVRRARGLIAGSKLNISLSSLNKINNALLLLEKNPTNANAIRTLKSQFKANPELVEELKHFNTFDGMQEFNQNLAPFKIDTKLYSGRNANQNYASRIQQTTDGKFMRFNSGLWNDLSLVSPVTTTGIHPTLFLTPSKASEYEAKILNGARNKDMMDLLAYSEEGKQLINKNPQLANILSEAGYDIKHTNLGHSAESVIVPQNDFLPQNQVKIENGKYLRSDGQGHFTELKEGDWFLDNNNQIRRVQSKDGKLTDLLDSDLETQRRQRIAQENEARGKELETKIKEAEQKGRDDLQRELNQENEARAVEDSPSTTSEPKYAYMKLSNGKTVQLEIKDGVAVDPKTGSTFELYPETTRVKEMDYTPKPSFYNEYFGTPKNPYDVDKGNPSKFKPLKWLDPNPFKQLQRTYTRPTKGDIPQHLISDYGVFRPANVNKRFMNNTREFSPQRAWIYGPLFGATVAGGITQTGLFGVGKSVGSGVGTAGKYLLFGSEPTDSTKTNKEPSTKQTNESTPIKTTYTIEELQDSINKNYQ